MDKLASRKFILAVLSLASLTLLTWFGKIDAGVYAAGLVATVGSYLTANVLAAK